MCHMTYEKQQYIKKINHYYLPLIPSLPVPTSNAHTHMYMKQVAFGMYKSIRRLGGREAFLG